MPAVRPAVAIMARAPSSGGKSRLAAHVAPDRLDALRHALLADAVAVARGSALPVYIFATPDSGTDDLRAIAGEVPVRVQVGADLGRRMSNAVAELLASGHDAVLLIGTDIPSLTPGDLAEAASLVADDVLVIGPAADGGYYLVGTTRDEPSLFEGVEWGTGHVTRDTIIRAEQAGFDVALLRKLTDLDTPADLDAVRGELAAANAAVAPALRRWLADND